MQKITDIDVYAAAQELDVAHTTLRNYDKIYPECRTGTRPLRLNVSKLWTKMYDKEPVKWGSWSTAEDRIAWVRNKPLVVKSNKNPLDQCNSNELPMDQSTSNGNPMDQNNPNELPMDQSPELENGFIVLRDSYQDQKAIILRLEVEADENKVQIKKRGRLNMMLIATIFPMVVILAFGASHVLRQGDKITDLDKQILAGETARAGLNTQILTEQGRAGKLEKNLQASREELNIQRKEAQNERQQHLSQIDNLTKRIAELSLTIESKHKNQEELTLLNKTLDVLTAGGAGSQLISTDLQIGPKLE